jgi:hypothetical protein
MLQIDHPYLRDTVSRIQWYLDVDIVTQRGVADLDEQEDVSG